MVSVRLCQGRLLVFQDSKGRSHNVPSKKIDTDAKQLTGLRINYNTASASGSTINEYPIWLLANIITTTADDCLKKLLTRSAFVFESWIICGSIVSRDSVELGAISPLSEKESSWECWRERNCPYDLVTVFGMTMRASSDCLGTVSMRLSVCEYGSIRGLM